MTDWQTIIALTCVAGALFVLARRARTLFRGRSGGCGPSGCGSCSTSASDAPLGERRPFVPLESLGNPKRRSADDEST